VDADQYCRDLEAHLCRQNGGHLVRIVGPAFEMVQRWFHLGIPFKVACQGIDRRVSRVVATTAARRRPVRLEFCEADVMDAFDAWRRAVGIRGTADAGAGSDGDAEPAEPRTRVSLAAHIERTIARLTGVRTQAREPSAWTDAVDDIVRALDQLVAPARRARGDVREGITRALGELDDRLIDTAVRVSEAAVVEDAAAEARTELEPFRARMPEAEFDRAMTRGRARALRIRLGLPTIARD